MAMSRTPAHKTSKKNVDDTGKQLSKCLPPRLLAASPLNFAASPLFLRSKKQYKLVNTRTIFLLISIDIESDSWQWHEFENVQEDNLARFEFSNFASS